MDRGLPVLIAQVGLRRPAVRLEHAAAEIHPRAAAQLAGAGHQRLAAVGRVAVRAPKCAEPQEPAAEQPPYVCREFKLPVELLLLALALRAPAVSLTEVARSDAEH